MTQANETVFFIFCMMALLGIGIGILWDVLKVIREKWFTKKGFVNLFDALFWAVITLTAFLILLYLNDGILRFFELLATLLGIILYFSAFSRLFRKIFLIFVNFITKICKILLTPVKLFHKIIYEIFYFLCVIPIVYLLNKLKKIFYFSKHEIRYAICLIKKT